MKLSARPRNYYSRQCRLCKGRGQVGYMVGRCYVDEECPTCKGNGFLRVRMPRRRRKK